MAQEIVLLRKDLQSVRRQTRGMREYQEGILYGKDVVLTFSRWAKVAAASTVTTLIEVFGVDLVVFTGVAGGTNTDLQIGDIVIGSALVQHDLDARPLFPRFEVPLLGKVVFDAPPAMVALARESAEEYTRAQIRRDIPAAALSAFGMRPIPKICEGLIVSGDKFMADPEAIVGLQAALLGAGLPSPLCVEMEGAAVAQVCYEHDVPVIVMRTISDKADHSAVIDFEAFVGQVASHLTRGIVKEFIRRV
jgi:adenosylhomocysteine nucleosidase